MTPSLKKNSSAYRYTKVCICSHSSFRSGQDYSTRLFVYSSYLVLVSSLVGSILLSLSFFCARKPCPLYIAILPVVARWALHYFLDMLTMGVTEYQSRLQPAGEGYHDEHTARTSFCKHTTSNWKYMLLTDVLNCAVWIANQNPMLVPLLHSKWDMTNLVCYLPFLFS
jgi:hypothetical protein